MSKQEVHPFTGGRHWLHGESLPPPPPPPPSSDNYELTYEDVAPWGYILDNGHFARF